MLIPDPTEFDMNNENPSPLMGEGWVGVMAPQERPFDQGFV